MKKKTLNLTKKLMLSKENITDLSTDQQMAINGGASVNICAQTDICPVIPTKFCPVIQTADCITRRHTWCWVAGSGCQ